MVEELPMWFRMFEPIAVVITIIAVIHMISTYKRFKGDLKKGYGALILGTILVGLSMVWKAIVEGELVVEGLMSEVILELFIILGIIVIAIGSRIISKTISKVK